MANKLLASPCVFSYFIAQPIGTECGYGSKRLEIRWAESKSPVGEEKTISYTNVAANFTNFPVLINTMGSDFARATTRGSCGDNSTGLVAGTCALRVSAPAPGLGREQAIWAATTRPRRVQPAWGNS